MSLPLPPQPDNPFLPLPPPAPAPKSPPPKDRWRLPRFLHRQARMLQCHPLDLWQQMQLGGARTPGKGH